MSENEKKVLFVSSSNWKPLQSYIFGSVKNCQIDVAKSYLAALNALKAEKYAHVVVNGCALQSNASDEDYDSLPEDLKNNLTHDIHSNNIHFVAQHFVAKTKQMHPNIHITVALTARSELCGYSVFKNNGTNEIIDNTDYRRLEEIIRTY
ncbi:MAG: hypothetical protein ACP5N3_03965 [Candidatus Nanoarchaeia archaeon]